MADSKLADLTAVTSPADTDILYVVVDPAGTPADRKVTVANLRGGVRLVDLEKKIGTGGDIVINQATPGPLASELGSGNLWNDGTDDLVVTAQAGDIIEFQLNGLWGAESTSVFLDVATIVAGAVVNYLGSGSSTFATLGVGGWFGESGTNLNMTIGGSVFYTVQEADVSGGTVTLRIYCDQSAGANKTLFRSTANAPLHACAKVWRV